jgi:hypothetical protein
VRVINDPPNLEIVDRQFGSSGDLLPQLQLCARWLLASQPKRTLGDFLLYSVATGDYNTGRRASLRNGD